jgi:hypothetical protein
VRLKNLWEPRDAITFDVVTSLAARLAEKLVDTLETAIGMLFVGRQMGWRMMVLMHDKNTIKKYEGILGNISIREEFPAERPLIKKCLAYRLIRGVTNFWKAVSGDIPGKRLTVLVK